MGWFWSNQDRRLRPAHAPLKFDRNGDDVWDDGVDLLVDPFGKPADLSVVGDWGGSGKTNIMKDMIGVFYSDRGLWKLDLNGNAKWDNGNADLRLKPFGQNGNLPVVGDWDGLGTARVGVFDPATGLWELDVNGNGQWDGCEVEACLGPFGQQGDLPAVRRW